MHRLASQLRQSVDDEERLYLELLVLRLFESSRMALLIRRGGFFVFLILKLDGFPDGIG